MRSGKWLGVVLAAGLLASACGGSSPGGSPGDSGGGGDAGISVGLAYDVGGLGDKSFNDAANRGLEQAIDEGIVAEEDTEFIEANATGSDRDDNVIALADEGFDLIVAVGFAFSEGINKIASDYPDVNFAVVDGFAEEAPNVSNLVFKEEEGSFLVGAAAAMKSEAGTVGFLGGQQGTGLIEKFEAGYAAGVKEVDPNIEVLVEYIGDSTAAFVDPTKGEALSAKMYDGGADIIYHAAGGSGAGLFKAAVEKDQLAIGVDSDQSLTASPEQRKLILTSMLKRVDTAVFEAIEQVADDDFQKGFQTFGLAEDGVDYAVNQYNDNPQLLSQEIQDELDGLKQEIIDGKIKVPTEPAS
ncbi:MAG: BMP family ABC transporter substrate-binding protein [Actinomycetota bacterium]|nr:BMP family ABC transporter substrate-binding protein [Actinomycetota bacterium]